MTALSPLASLAQVRAVDPAFAFPLVGSDRMRPGPGAHSPSSLDALLDALRSERKLLDELSATMRRQRAAVGSDDLQAVDDSVFATHRILATLGQARVRRRQLNRLLSGIDDLPARELDGVLGAQMTDALRDARDELQASAGALSREVDVNRRVLRDALVAGDQQARTLTGVGAELGSSPGYAAPNMTPNASTLPAGGLLIDRRG
jgi:hypothetical protein